MSLLNKASLIQIPSGYKDGTLYSAKPTNGDGDFTFSRGSNLAATRVNSEGLIEKGRENLLLQSNTFNTTWVNNLGGAITGGQSGYDGSNDAWEINKNTTSFRRLEQNVSLTGIWTFSVYAKAGTLEEMALRDGTSGDRAEFDLDSGTIINNGGGTIIERNMTDVGGGWYRCSITCNSTNTLVQIYIDWNETIGGNIYIQDAQLEQGLVATDYIETTTTTAQAGILEDMPRLDYSGGASCPSLLLEPQRSNLVSQSEYIGDSTYISGGGAGATITRTDNYGISPDGTQNATRVEISRGSSYAELYNRITTTNGETYTISFWAKSLDGTPTLYTVWNDAYANEVTFTTDWVRYTYTFVASGTTNGFNLVTWTNLPTTSTSADLLIWGVQIEAGSYPTSYIPTYGSSVTRSEDESYNSSATFLEQNQGTLLIEFNRIGESGSSFENAFFISDGTLSNFVNIVLDISASRYKAQVRSGGSTSGVVTATTSYSGNLKIALAFSSNDLVMYINGDLQGTDTSVTLPSNTLDKMGLGGYYTTFYGDTLRANYKQALYFPTRLTNDELASLTTI